GVGALAAFPGGVMNRDENDERGIRDGRKTEKRSVVIVSIVMGYRVEDLRGACLTGRSVAFESAVETGSTAKHHAFHHLPHCDGGFRFDNAHGRFDRLQLVATFQDE